MIKNLARRFNSRFSKNGWLPIVYKLNSRQPSIGLTFDDGPTPETTLRVLDLLAASDARATFFLCGKRAASHPELVAAIVRAGHDVYAHGYQHVRLDCMSESEALTELNRTEAILARHRPTPAPYLVRLPYGSGHRNARIHHMLRRWRPDCQLVHWRYDFKDFQLAEGCIDRAELTARCQAAVERAFATSYFVGSVVLMHENPFEADGYLVPDIAAALLTEILNGAA